MVNKGEKCWPPSLTPPCLPSSYNCPKSTLNDVIVTLSKRRDDNTQVILMVDEVLTNKLDKSTVDWSDLATDTEGVDLLLAVSPHGSSYAEHDEPLRIVPPPRGEKMLPWRLRTRHRNSAFIQVPFQAYVVEKWRAH